MFNFIKNKINMRKIILLGIACLLLCSCGNQFKDTVWSGSCDNCDKFNSDIELKFISDKDVIVMINYNYKYYTYEYKKPMIKLYATNLKNVLAFTGHIDNNEINLLDEDNRLYQLTKNIYGGWIIDNRINKTMAKQLYDKVRKLDRSFDISEEQFYKGLSKESARRQLYNNLKLLDSSFNIPYDRFVERLGFGATSKLQKLYSKLLETYNLPDYATFERAMADSTKRRQLYDELYKEYNWPDYDTFTNDIGF